MKKINRILLVGGLAILLLFINFSIDINNSNKAEVSLEFMGTKALANIDNCTDNGFRTWDAPNPLRPSGKDCWCEDRSKVKDDCN